MEKAYSPKALIEELKGHGLELAEEAAKAIIEGTFDWLEKSAKASVSQADDLALLVYPTIKKFALEKAELINKEG